MLLIDFNGFLIYDENGNQIKGPTSYYSGYIGWPTALSLKNGGFIISINDKDDYRGTSYIYEQKGGLFQGNLVVNNSAFFVNGKTGRVGIGIAKPEGLLHISANPYSDIYVENGTWYSFSGWNSVANLNDSDWDTVSTKSFDAESFINYSIPSEGIESSEWIIKISPTKLVKADLPESCFDGKNEFRTLDLGKEKMKKFLHQTIHYK